MADRIRSATAWLLAVKAACSAINKSMKLVAVLVETVESGVESVEAFIMAVFCGAG
jgi:hypothetical protein